MMNFILNHLIIIIACILMLLVLPFIFRFFLKIALILVSIVVVGTILFGPKFLNNFQKPIESTHEFAQSTIQPFIKNELKNAKFDYNPVTKQYVIQGPFFEIDGASDQNNAVMLFQGKKYNIDVSFLKSFMEKQIGQQTPHQTTI